VPRPTERPSRGSGPPDDPRRPLPRATPSRTARRALVIDDENSIRLALRRFLTRDGWQVDDAADGQLALDKLMGAPETRAHYDLIICDLRMPGVSGAELYDWMHLNRPELLARLIMATGDAVSAEAATFVGRTACPVLQKPFELTELRALVHRIAASG
jgi:DNA-binding NtrC family response regulator